LTRRLPLRLDEIELQMKALIRSLPKFLDEKDFEETFSAACKDEENRQSQDADGGTFGLHDLIDNAE
jgi:hypothetical protein